MNRRHVSIQKHTIRTPDERCADPRTRDPRRENAFAKRDVGALSLGVGGVSSTSGCASVLPGRLVRKGEGAVSGEVSAASTADRVPRTCASCSVRNRCVYSRRWRSCRLWISSRQFASIICHMTLCESPHIHASTALINTYAHLARMLAAEVADNGCVHARTAKALLSNLQLCGLHCAHVCDSPTGEE